MWRTVLEHTGLARPRVVLGCRIRSGFYALSASLLSDKSETVRDFLFFTETSRSEKLCCSCCRQP